MLMTRIDYFGGIPSLVALPVGSIDTRNSKLPAPYVPYLSQNDGDGDVLLLFMASAFRACTAE